MSQYVEERNVWMARQPISLSYFISLFLSLFLSTCLHFFLPGFFSFFLANTFKTHHDMFHDRARYSQICHPVTPDEIELVWGVGLFAGTTEHRR